MTERPVQVQDTERELVGFRLVGIRWEPVYRARHPKSDTECDTSASGGDITPREDAP